MANQISFDVPHEVKEAIYLAADRAGEIAANQGVKRFDKLSIIMDLTATHANGTPLDWGRLLKADDFNFCHDVFGISRHLDRETGKLTDCFSPRFSSRSSAAA